MILALCLLAYLLTGFLANELIYKYVKKNKPDMQTDFELNFRSISRRIVFSALYPLLIVAAGLIAVQRSIKR